jgi:hypothetical protein
MAIKKVISGEQPFQVEAPRFCVGASESGYTLNYSADGVTYTPWEVGTPIGENLVVTEVAAGMFFFLEGNTDDVVVTW